MRLCQSLAVSVFAAAAAGQNIVFSIPDSNAAAGTCNVIPFGSTSTTSGFASCRQQTLITAADMQGTSGRICGLRFAPCDTAVRHYDALVIRMGHTTATSLSSNFDTNLPPLAGVILLDVKDHTWPTVADVWNDVGLQRPFAYNGTDNIVVDIITTNGWLVSGSGGSAGFHRETRQRIYATSYAGQTSGTSSATALKMQVHLGEASTWTFGEGCLGSNGVPVLAFGGSSRLGQVSTVSLSGGAKGSAALLNAGTTNTSQAFPIDLGLFGAPTCKLFHDIQGSAGLGTDPIGAAQVQLPIPNDPALVCGRLFFQWVVLDPAANTLGATTSNYGRLVVGL